MKNVLIASTIAALLAGCGSSGGGGYSSSPSYTPGAPGDPALQPLRAGYEPSPCGTLYGYPVPCTPRFPEFNDPMSGSSASAGSFFPYAESGPTEFRFDSVIAIPSASASHVSPWFSSLYFDAQRNFSYIPPVHETAPDGFDSRHSPMLSLNAVGGNGLTLTYLPRTSPSGQSRFLALEPARESAIVANPYALGWDHQSFGVWDSHVGSELSARSFGDETPPWASVPASGQATFVGKLGGFYTSPSGEGAVAVSQLAVKADFGARTLNFASSFTKLTRDARLATAAPHLDLSGTLTYVAGGSRFAGDLKNAGGNLNGSTVGRFYGPSAWELGGVFAVKSATGVESFTGAYGATR